MWGIWEVLKRGRSEIPHFSSKMQLFAPCSGIKCKKEKKSATKGEIPAKKSEEKRQKAKKKGRFPPAPSTPTPLRTSQGIMVSAHVSKRVAKSSTKWLKVPHVALKWLEVTFSVPLTRALGCTSNINNYVHQNFRFVQQVLKRGCLNVGAWNPQESGRKTATFLQRSFFDFAVQFFRLLQRSFRWKWLPRRRKANVAVQLLQRSTLKAAGRNFRFRLWHVAGVGFRGVGFRTCWFVI